jgi:hypothetical protein
MGLAINSYPHQHRQKLPSLLKNVEVGGGGRGPRASEVLLVVINKIHSTLGRVLA